MNNAFVGQVASLRRQTYDLRDDIRMKRHEGGGGAQEVTRGGAKNLRREAFLRDARLSGTWCWSKSRSVGAKGENEEYIIYNI